MAEFVGNHTLQFISIQPLDTAPGHRHRRVVDRIARGESVDVRFIPHDVDRRYRHSRSDRHLLHHIDVLALEDMRGGVIHLDSPHQLGDRRAAGTQAEDLDQAGQATGQECASHHPRQGLRLPEATCEARPVLPEAAPVLVLQEEGEKKVEGRDDPHNGQGEQDDQASRRTTRSLLVLKEIHRHGLDSSRPGSLHVKASLSLSVLIRARQVGRSQKRRHGYAKGMGKGAQQLRLLYLDDPISKDTVTAGHQGLLANARRRACQPAD